MNKVEFHRFTRAEFLQRIGRGPVEDFFERFRRELSVARLSLPALHLEDAEYLSGVAELVKAPGRFPRGLTEALLAVVSMARAEGMDQLRAAVRAAGLAVPCNPEAPAEQFCFQVAVANDKLLMNEYWKLVRDQLFGMDHFAHVASDQAGPDEPAQSRPLSELARELILAVRGWLESAGAGREQPQVDILPDEDGAHLVLVDPGARGATEAAEARWSQRYWERWDAIFCSARRGEVQIAAHHRGLAEIYRQVMSCWLGGRADFLCASPISPLALIRSERADALDTINVRDIESMDLRTWQVDSGNGNHETTTVQADDLLRRGAAAGTEPCFLDLPGQLARVDLLVKFADSRRPRRAELWWPNHLKLESLSDGPVLARWLRGLGVRKAA